MTMTNPNYNNFYIICGKGGIMLSHILMTAMCKQLLHIQHMHSLRLTPQCCVFLYRTMNTVMFHPSAACRNNTGVFYPEFHPWHAQTCSNKCSSSKLYVIKY